MYNCLVFNPRVPCHLSITEDCHYFPQLDSELDRLSDESSGQGFGDFHGAMFTDVFFKLDAASSIMNSFTEVNRVRRTQTAHFLPCRNLISVLFNPGNSHDIYSLTSETDLAPTWVLWCTWRPVQCVGHIDGLMQKRRNSLLTHWSYVSVQYIVVMKLPLI